MKTHPVAMCTRQDAKPLVEVNWKREDMKGKPLSSIYLLDHSSSTQADYLNALKRNPKVISQFVSKLSKTFHARLLSVHKDPLTLVLCHRTADDFRYLTENRQALIELIRKLIPYQDNAGRLELKVSFHGGEGDTKFKRLMDTGEHYRNRTLSELGFEANEVAEIDQRLECISKKLSKQRENFDSRLQSQNERLETVRNEIDKISQHMQRQVDERQVRTGADREASSLNHNLSTGEQTSSHEQRSPSLEKQTSFSKKQTSSHGTWSSTQGKLSSSLEKQSSSHGKQSSSNGKRLPSLEKQSPSQSKGKQSTSFDVESRTSWDNESPSIDHHFPNGEEISSDGKETSSHEKEPMLHEEQSSSQGIKSSSLHVMSQPNEDWSLLKRSESSDKQSTLKKKSPPNSQEKLTSADTSTLGARNATDKNAHDVVLTKPMRTRNEDSISLNGHIDNRDDHGKYTQPNPLVNQDDQEDEFKTFENENCNNCYDNNDDEDDFDDDDDESDDGQDDIDDNDAASGDDEDDIGDDDSDDNDEGKEDVIDELQKAIEDLIQRRARGEDSCSTTRTPDPYSFRSNSGLLTSPFKLEHVLLRMGMDVTKETHPKLEVEHAAICVLNYFREVTLSNVHHRIWRMVDMAIENEPTPIPRSEKSFDTILCLDNFGTMSRESLSRLKEIALDFINGIEDIADEYGLEENIAVVALGSSPQILHHLSIDYDSIRETIENLECGGYKSLAYVRGVLMSLAASTRGGVCDLGGYLRVPPRLVVITDGFVLGKAEGCQTDVETVTTYTAFVQLQFPFIRQNIFGDVIIVPNGPVNENMLNIYIKKCKGRLVNDIASLCNNQRLKRHAAQILKYIDSQCGTNRSTATNLLQIVQAFTAGFTQTEKLEIADIVKERYEPEVPAASSVSSYDNINEESTLPPLGSRVIRGPDWPGKDEDGNGPGTVINHELDKVNLWVLWDNNVLLYRHRYGLGYYDVCPVDDHPMLPDESDLVLRIGMQVERGPDWHESYGDQDGGPGSYGTVIRYNYLRVMVRWNNGEMHEYRFGENGRYDLIIRSCYDKVKDYKTGRKEVVSAAGSRPKYATRDSTERRQKKKEVHSNTTSPQYTPTRWYWQDPDGSWIPYSHGDNEKLIKTYTRRPDGSCLIERDGINYRVLFKTLEEKPIDKTKGGDSRNVRFE